MTELIDENRKLKEKIEQIKIAHSAIYALSTILHGNTSDIESYDVQGIAWMLDQIDSQISETLAE